MAKRTSTQGFDVSSTRARSGRACSFRRGINATRAHLRSVQPGRRGHSARTSVTAATEVAEQYSMTAAGPATRISTTVRTSSCWAPTRCRSTFSSAARTSSFAACRTGGAAPEHSGARGRRCRRRRRRWAGPYSAGRHDQERQPDPRRLRLRHRTICTSSISRSRSGSRSIGIDSASTSTPTTCSTATGRSRSPTRSRRRRPAPGSGRPTCCRPGSSSSACSSSSEVRTTARAVCRPQPVVMPKRLSYCESRPSGTPLAGARLCSIAQPAQSS